MEMTESSLPIWVIIAIIGFLFLNFVAYNNYYLSKKDKIKAQCLKGKPARQRNNSLLRLERRVDEEVYPLMILVFYVLVSVCFCVENRKKIILDEHIVFSILVTLIIWAIIALAVIFVMTAMMISCQDNAIKDLKKYYDKHFGVTVINIDKDQEKEYYKYLKS